jgi:hypothetical protein
VGGSNKASDHVCYILFEKENLVRLTNDYRVLDQGWLLMCQCRPLHVHESHSVQAQEEGPLVPGGRGGTGSIDMGQSSNNMGLEWTGFRICVTPELPSQVRIKSLITNNPAHTACRCSVYDCIFFLCRVKLNQVKEL